MNILVVGAESFIANHFCEKIENESNYKLIKTSKNKKKKFIQLNLLNRNNNLDLLKNKKIDCLIDFGWIGVFGKYRDSNIQKKNIAYTKNLIDLSKNLKIKKIISFGSQAEYGTNIKFPNENSPAKPKTFYGKIKLKKLELLSKYCKKNKINFIWFRIFSSYGIKEKYNWLIPYLVKNLLLKNTVSITAGEQVCDYIYIDDLISAIILSIKNKKMKGVYNLGSSKGIKIKTIVKLILKILKIKKFDKIKFKRNRKKYIPELVANTNKIKKLGWYPKISIEKGLKKVIKYEAKLKKR